MINVTSSTRFLTLSEAAEILAVDYTTIDRYAKTGYRGRKLEVVKVGGHRRTTLAAIQTFISGEEPEPDVSRARDVELERSLEHHRIR